jgi:outer membrane protein OmpA-like peptidoglycan-associated protein
MTPKLLKNSTALVLVTALCLPVPQSGALAQTGGVDCTANPDRQACANAATGKKKDKPGTDKEMAPSGKATGNEPVKKAQPPAEASEPDAAAPAQEPAAEEAAPAEQPPAEASEPEAAPAPDGQDQETPAADAAPAPDEPAETGAPVPAAPEPQAEEAAPAAKPSADGSGEGQLAEPQASETRQPEAEAPEAPVEKPEAPAEDAAPEDKPAVAPDAPAETPEDKPEAPVEETVPEEKPAQDQTHSDGTETEQPAAEADQPSGETGRTSADEAEARTDDQPAGERDGVVDQAEATGDVTEEAGEPIEREAAAEPEEPAAVVEDDISEAQRAEVRQQEERRREEARDRRLELLGAAAVGAGIGMLIPALGGKVVEDQGDRIIVERDGDYYVRKDESSLLRYGDAEFRAEHLRGGRTRETVTRQNGVRIVTIRDEGGYVLYRSRILPDGREYVLIDNRRQDRRRRDWDRELPPLRVDIPRERYIVPAGRADYERIYSTFTAPPVEPVEQAYSLRDVRESERLRDKVRRVDLDTITFDTGSAVVRRSQVPLLEDIARASVALIEEDPSTVLLVEGHTDAVGPDILNLALSDRRAETVARILAEIYDVPPENMVVQGYGEDYLKIDTEAAEERNRRVTIRNITPLLSARNR